MTKQIGKSPLINNITRWSIIISASCIALTLIISWLLWITLYRTTIDESLSFFGNKTIAQGYGINFDFLILSIISLGVAIITLVVALPLIFYRKKNGFTVIVSLLNFILTALILTAAILFIMTSYNFYGDFYNVFGLNQMLVVFLPWVLVAIFDLFWLFNSLWCLISAANGVNFIPTVETEAKAQYQELNDLPAEEKVVLPTDTIIIPQMPAANEVNNQPAEVIDEIHITPVAENNQNQAIEIKNEPQQQINTAPNQEINIIAEPQKSYEEIPAKDSGPGPFAVYQEGENGNYVLLKDYTSADNSTDNHQTFEEVQPYIEGVMTPKIEDIAPEVANPPEPAPEVKQQIKPISNWTEAQIEEIWNKAQIINDVNPKLYRKDYAGAWMFRNAFTTVLEETNVRSYAWTIVNHRPLSQDGDNSVDNLDPLNVTNAITKGEDYPKWKTKISSSGNENVVKEQNWKARL